MGEIIGIGTPFLTAFGIVWVVLRHKYRMAQLKAGASDDAWQRERKQLEDRIANLESIVIAHDEALKLRAAASPQAALPAKAS